MVQFILNFTFKILPQKGTFLDNQKIFKLIKNYAKIEITGLINEKAISKDSYYTTQQSYRVN